MNATPRRAIADSQLTVIDAAAVSVAAQVVAIGDVFSSAQLAKAQAAILCASGGNVRFSISDALTPAADSGLCAPESTNTLVTGPVLVNALAFISESGTVNLTIFLMQ